MTSVLYVLDPLSEEIGLRPIKAKIVDADDGVVTLVVHEAISFGVARYRVGSHLKLSEKNVHEKAHELVYNDRKVYLTLDAWKKREAALASTKETGSVAFRSERSKEKAAIFKKFWSFKIDKEWDKALEVLVQLETEGYSKPEEISILLGLLIKDQGGLK